jgi:signal transduction histidine kinase
MRKRYLKKDGSVIWCETTGAVVSPDGAEPYAVGIVVDVTDAMRAEEEVAAYQARLRAMAAELANTQERERQAIATDLHDNVGQLLAMGAMQLQLLADGRSADARGAARDIARMLESALEATRSLTFQLSPPALQQFGLVPALEWLAEKMTEDHGLSVSVSGPAAGDALAQGLRRLLYRSVRELLFNVVRHAGAEEARVDVTATVGLVRVVVADDGRGFAPGDPVGSHAGGFGLLSVREGLGAVGGAMEINSEPGMGAAIVLTVPLGGEDAGGFRQGGGPQGGDGA